MSRESLVTTSLAWPAVSGLICRTQSAPVAYPPRFTGRDSFAFVNEVNGSFRKSGFPVRRGCLTTALPSASERNEVGLNHGSSIGCQFRDVRPLLTLR